MEVGARTRGFLPVADDLLRAEIKHGEHGTSAATTALVFALVYRYCRLASRHRFDGAVSVICQELQLSAPPVSASLRWLVDEGYLEKVERIGMPAVYTLTDKWSMEVQVVGGSKESLEGSKESLEVPPKNLGTNKTRNKTTESLKPKRKWKDFESEVFESFGQVTCTNSKTGKPKAFVGQLAKVFGSATDADVAKSIELLGQWLKEDGKFVSAGNAVARAERWLARRKDPTTAAGQTNYGSRDYWKKHATRK